MIYLIAQILILLLVCLAFSALARPRVIAILVSVVLAAFVSAQISSVYMGGSLIDYKYYLHTGAVDFKLMFEFFLLETVVSLLVVVLLSIFIFKGGNYIRSRKTRVKWSVVGVLLFIGIPLMCLPKGVLNQLNDIAEMTTVGERSFDEALSGLSIPKEAYVTPENVTAQKGKNIIAISLESYEQGFLREPFTALTPNLNRLAKDYTYFNMLQTPGSNWTSGSVYSSITGFPAYFKTKPNETFQGAAALKLTSVGEVLKKAGYDMTYLLGNKEFAGTENMLRALHFEVRSEKDFDTSYPKSGWGLHDKDLFEEAKKTILQKKKGTKPFALFMSTISTHLPDGVYDERMEEVISEKRSSLEFMIAAVDHILGDFVGFLEKEGLLENTVFYIYPDHLIMGTAPTILQDFKTLRELYLLTNAKEKDLSYNSNEEICQLDIPKIILAGAQVKHNVKFFRDFIPEDKPISDYIYKHKKDIVAFNEAALYVQGVGDGMKLEYTGTNGLRLSANGFERIIPNIYKDRTKAHVFIFDNRARFVRDEVTTAYEAFQTDKYKGGELYLIVQQKEGELYAMLRTGHKVGVAKKGAKQITFNKSDFEVVQQWDFPGDEFRLLAQPNYNYIIPQDLIYLTAGVGGLGEIRTPGEIKIGKLKLPFGKGINILTKTGDDYEVNTLDVASDPAKYIPELIRQVEKLKKEKRFFALLTQEWKGGAQQYASELKKVGLDLLPTVKSGHAYIGYSYEGYISEYKLHKPISISLPQYTRPSIRSREQIEADAKNPQKFIAHAGGAIDHFDYTNSLDALNLSYANGYRLFELDIIKTTDGHYVAAHDWNYWGLHTNQRERVAVSRAQFMKHKKEGRYTPMDMDVINKWFAEHPDAILITDKVNEPQQFASVFVDKHRLMMELFSIEAVEEAIKAGIEVIPSERVLEEIEGDKAIWLKERGIKQVALSRLNFREKLPLFKSLKANGIKVYVYHVNSEKGKDEAYVLLNEFDYIYGMYADEWRLN